MSRPDQLPDNTAEQFPDVWKLSTADNNATLHGFRRFKTTHLVNLRFLENEIAVIDHTVYQAGLSLPSSATKEDRLGVRQAKRDPEWPKVEEVIDRKLILRLRDLLRQYDEALAAFKLIMDMETTYLIDDKIQSDLRTDFTVFEKFKTRLIRTDLSPRAKRDPLHHRLRQLLHKWQYSRLLKRESEMGVGTETLRGSTCGVNCKAAMHGLDYNNALVAELLTRFLMALLMVLFVVVPMIGLSLTPNKKAQLAVVASCVVVFTFLVSTLLRTSSLEMAMASAAYAAVLTVFLSNS